MLIRNGLVVPQNTINSNIKPIQKNPNKLSNNHSKCVFLQNKTCMQLKLAYNWRCMPHLILTSIISIIDSANRSANICRFLYIPNPCLSLGLPNT